MRYLPIHIDLKDQRVVVIGGEAAAEAKLRTLVKTDAHIIVISETVNPEIKKWADAKKITLWRRVFLPEDLDDARLVYAATEDDILNAEIAELGKAKGILVNAADQKTACHFITPALVDRSPVVISIGTEGYSPSLGRALKTDLEAKLPSSLGMLVCKINNLRGHVKLSIPSLSGRQKFWAQIFGTQNLYGQIKLSADDLEREVLKALEVETREGERASEASGHVVLVGAGPGDPDLLTLQARQKLHSADVIVYDRLVSQGVLDFGRREAEYIYVGKEPGGVSTSQSDINDILIKKANEGHFIVRLKSGDPLIFGRADEELEALIEHGVSYDIVPGITSAAAAAAQIGTSLTTRGKNKSVTFMTGHDARGFAEQDWKSLAVEGTRAAVYMGVGAARFIQGRLLLHGGLADSPVTVVENASRATQIILSTTLGELSQDIQTKGIKGPAILLLGYASRKHNGSEHKSALRSENINHKRPVKERKL